MLVANCSVEYEGRLGARLPPAPRLVILKADGSLAVHADAKAYKPLNWMSPPCTVREEDGRLVATNPSGERLCVELHEVLHDATSRARRRPRAGRGDGVGQLQELLPTGRRARHDLRLVRREYPTDIGPVDPCAATPTTARRRDRGEAGGRDRGAWNSCSTTRERSTSIRA